MLTRHIGAVIIVNEPHRHRTFPEAGTAALFSQHTQYPKSLPKATDKDTEESVLELSILHIDLFHSFSYTEMEEVAYEYKIF